MDDQELLRRYLSGSQAAFEELVQRYVNLVYSAALRQARDAQHGVVRPGIGLAG